MILLNDAYFKAAVENVQIDFSKLDVRVGQILSCENHPNAQNLYVEQIDVGETRPRSVCSGLVSHIKPDEVIQNLIYKTSAKSDYI